MTARQNSAPGPGFRDPVLDSQQTFRSLLDALARPGRLCTTAAFLEPPAPISPATAAIALTLFDHDTPVWLDAGAASDAVRAFLAFHCGCPAAREPGVAAFALIAEPLGMPALDEFFQGEELYPDSSTTLILDVPSLEDGVPVRLRGPGILESTHIAPRGLPKGFWSWVAENHAGFPLGVDMIFACGSSLIGLPRSTVAEV